MALRDTVFQDHMARYVYIFKILTVLTVMTIVFSVYLVIHVPEKVVERERLAVWKTKIGKQNCSSGNTCNVNESVTVVKSNIVAEKFTDDRFYRLRSSKVNPYETKWNIIPKSLCDERENSRPPFLVVLIPSIPERSDTRAAIRRTWGSVARTNTWPNSSLNEMIKVVFLLGNRSPVPGHEMMIQEERRKYNDIVQGDFYDSYYNLTRKILMGLKWIAMYCGEVDYILKSDDDIFVHIPRLIAFLKNNPHDLRGSIYGFIQTGAKVRRTGKWAVSKIQFPLKVYPTYAVGNTYVISGNLAPRLIRVSEYMPYLSIEDSFITGVLAKLVSASHKLVPGFTQWLEKAPNPCDFITGKKITGNKVTIQLMTSIWKTLSKPINICVGNNSVHSNHH